MSNRGAPSVMRRNLKPTIHSAPSTFTLYRVNGGSVLHDR
jgi:hypothetical protein